MLRLKELVNLGKLQDPAGVETVGLLSQRVEVAIHLSEHLSWNQGLGPLTFPPALSTDEDR